MCDLPGPGLEPVSPALAGRFLTTVPPGKPIHCLDYYRFAGSLEIGKSEFSKFVLQKDLLILLIFLLMTDPGTYFQDTFLALDTSFVNWDLLLS